MCDSLAAKCRRRCEWSLVDQLPPVRSRSDFADAWLRLTLERNEVRIDVRQLVLAVPLRRVAVPHACNLKTTGDSSNETRLVRSRVIPERIGIPVGNVGRILERAASVG